MEKEIRNRDEQCGESMEASTEDKDGKVWYELVEDQCFKGR